MYGVWYSVLYMYVPTYSVRLDSLGPVPQFTLAAPPVVVHSEQKGCIIHCLESASKVWVDGHQHVSQCRACMCLAILVPTCISASRVVLVLSMSFLDESLVIVTSLLMGLLLHHYPHLRTTWATPLCPHLQHFVNPCLHVLY